MDGGGDRARYTNARPPGLTGVVQAHNGPPPGLPYPNQANPFQQPISFQNRPNGYPFYSQQPPLVHSNQTLPVSFQINPVMAQQQQQSFHPHGQLHDSPRKTSIDDSLLFEQHDSTTAGIKPLIQNIVGSMGNGGTYSHFGPTRSLHLGGLGFQQNQQHQPMSLSEPPTYNNNTEPIPDPFNSTTLEGQFKQKIEHKIRQKQLLQLQQEGGFGLPTPLILTATTSSVTSGSGGSGVIGSGKQSPNHFAAEGCLPRPATPTNSLRTKDHVVESSSRPETPGKPSYLEMLTKNVKKEQQASGPTTARRPSLGSQGQLPSNPLSQMHSQSSGSRKSAESSPMGSTTPSSTASSSPINRPKINSAQPQNGQKGNKENHVKSSGGIKVPVSPPQSPMEEQKKNSNGWIKTGSKAASKKQQHHAQQLIGGGGNGIHFDFEQIDKDGSSSRNSSEGEGVVLGKKKKRGGGAGEQPATGGTSLERRFSDHKTGNLSYTGRKGRANHETNNKPARSRREERNCIVRRVRMASKIWLGHLIKALIWFWTLVSNVTALSATLSMTLIMDGWVWWNTQALPYCRQQFIMIKLKVHSGWKRAKDFLARRPKQPPPDKNEKYDELLSVIGPEKNIILPSTGDEALKRLLAVRGQDPYSILGVKSDSSEEIIRRYYKRQAVLVHPDKNLVPGAEEAFKILGKAFEMVGEPANRTKFHRNLLQETVKERFMGEFGNLFEELRKKMEMACSTIRCTKCKARHKKNKTDRPVFAARYCAQCRIHHAAREGELWAEKSGFLGLSRVYYACMTNAIWEINEWGRCQRASLKHLEPNSHNVHYRLVSGGQQNGKPPPPSNATQPPEEDDLLDPENLERMDDWDSLFNNLCRQGTATGANGNTGPAGATTANKRPSAATATGTNVGGKKGKKGKRK